MCVHCGFQAEDGIRDICVFFFKQKTAYEIYQCDWSSDVCSSDLDCMVAISSSLVRPLVSSGQFKKVRKCLGRDYILFGKVVKGRGWGRKLGFPTVNIELEHGSQIVPEDGVFAGWACFGDNVHSARSSRLYSAATSIGHCETFADGKWQIEAFLLGYGTPVKDSYGSDVGTGESLVGKSLLLGFTEKIRQQKRFGSVEELAEAIKADCENIRKIKK